MRQAAVMLIIKEGLILGVSRRLDPNKFGLPGGKLEDNEFPIDAAIRETFEETGVKVSSASFLYERIEPPGSPDGYAFQTYCYYADSWSGEASKLEESEVKWVTENELASGAFPEHNINTIAVFKTLYPNVYIK